MWLQAESINQWRFAVKSSLMSAMRDTRARTALLSWFAALLAEGRPRTAAKKVPHGGVGSWGWGVGLVRGWPYILHPARCTLHPTR